MKVSSPYSLAICLPVWNRLDLFRCCYESLHRQLEGVESAIWIYDNGSDRETRQFLHQLESEDRFLVKTFLPRNMGVPYVVNLFYDMATQPCEFGGHRAPTHLMIADADAYFKKPIRHLLEILESDNHYAVISGHDAIEHESLKTGCCLVEGEMVTVKEKEVERMLSLVMRSQELGACCPFPHHRDRDVDWELAKWSPASLAIRGRKLAAVDYVAHLGLCDSTWSLENSPAGPEELAEIGDLLEAEGLLTPERSVRLREFAQVVR